MRKSYFTLLGLVIVILIISVLTCLMINAYFFRSLSEEVDKNNQENSQQALEADAGSLEPYKSLDTDSTKPNSAIDAAHQAIDVYNKNVIERQKQYDDLRQ
ncbi:MAG: type II secretion system protein [Candidatus Omnitrophica bacterium]|nr:type II secretion system protein [Candidatus Omnitrophota bacterium]